MATANINDVDLYYEVHGDGAPLMLIAGLASDSQSWGPVITDLARRCRVIVFDNRGAGRTTPQDADVRVPRMADDCIALAAHLGLPSVHLLGHSMGGFIALDCAIRYPDHVGKLILAGTSPRSGKRNAALLSDWAAHLESGMDPGTWFRNIFYWIFTQRFFDNEEAVEEALRYAVEYPYPQSRAAFRSQVKAIAEFHCEERLQAVTARTMVICGEEDLLFPPDDCRRLAEAVQGAKFVLVGGAAHSIHIENPAAFVECVLDFLSQP
jgi:pimeloyl-ACP methyl ester carboxylesterase